MGNEVAVKVAGNVKILWETFKGGVKRLKNYREPL